MTLTIVPPYKRIAVCPPLGPVDVLHRLLEGDVHVAVHGLELTWSNVSINSRHPSEIPRPQLSQKWIPKEKASEMHTLVDDTRVQLHSHRVPDDVAEEAGGVLPFALASVLHFSLCREGSGWRAFEILVGELSWALGGCEDGYRWDGVLAMRSSRTSE